MIFLSSSIQNTYLNPAFLIHLWKYQTAEKPSELCFYIEQNIWKKFINGIGKEKKIVVPYVIFTISMAI